MHEVLVNRFGGLSLPRKSVVRLTDRPDMTLDDYQQYNKAGGVGRGHLVEQEHLCGLIVLINFGNFHRSYICVRFMNLTA